eukprot:Skav235115  [mRNA]  locus=scaffold3581:46390:51715:- [translate_table: standard]
MLSQVKFEGRHVADNQARDAVVSCPGMAVGWLVGHPLGCLERRRWRVQPLLGPMLQVTDQQATGKSSQEVVDVIAPSPLLGMGRATKHTKAIGVVNSSKQLDAFVLGDGFPVVTAHGYADMIGPLDAGSYQPPGGIRYATQRPVCQQDGGVDVHVESLAVATRAAPAAPGSMGLPPQQQFGSPYQPAPFAQPSQMSQAMYGNQAGNLSVAPLNQMQQLPPQSNLYAQPPFSQPPGLPMDGPLAADANARLCTCGEPALLLNVKKEGPNQGRPFFKCAKQHPDQPCSFFEWADEPPRGASNVTQGGAPQAQQAGPNCRCGQATLILTVKKDGPNQGRTFYKCAQGQCGFFQWADQEPEPPGPPCSCGVPSVRKTVSKEGPNRGRPFMAGSLELGMEIDR